MQSSMERPIRDSLLTIRMSPSRAHPAPSRSFGRARPFCRMLFPRQTRRGRDLSRWRKPGFRCGSLSRSWVSVETDPQIAEDAPCRGISDKMIILTKSCHFIDEVYHAGFVLLQAHSKRPFPSNYPALDHQCPECAYAPRFKNLKKQTLYHFRNRKDARADWAIAPKKYVNERIILECWDDLLRLVVTIKLKKATASSIFRRLNS